MHFFLTPFNKKESCKMIKAISIKIRTWKRKRKKNYTQWKTCLSSNEWSDNYTFPCTTWLMLITTTYITLCPAFTPEGPGLAECPDILLPVSGRPGDALLLDDLLLPDTTCRLSIPHHVSIIHYSHIKTQHLPNDKNISVICWIIYPIWMTFEKQQKI